MELKDYRDELDKIDEAIVALFKARMTTVSYIADYKSAKGLPTLSPDREQEVLARVRALSGVELAPYTAVLFETIMRLSREYQESLRDE